MRDTSDGAAGYVAVMPSEAALAWLENVLPRIMRSLMDADNLDMPLFQLPLAQMRLAYALYPDGSTPELATVGDTMGRLSERLGVRHNALTQAADRLVKHALAERLSDPNDRRIVRLRLTATGAAWVRQRRQRRHDHLASVWGSLDECERREFVHAVNVLLAVTDRSDAHTRAERQGNCCREGSSQHLEDVSAPIPTVEETLARFAAWSSSGTAVEREDPGTK